MAAWLVIAALLLLTKPDGTAIWIVEANVVAVLAMPHVGKAATAVVTMGGVFYVREPPEEVAKRLGNAPPEDRPR